MRTRLPPRLRLTSSLTYAHSSFPSANTAASSLRLLTSPGASQGSQARVSTSAALYTLAHSSCTNQSRLNWSQTAHQARPHRPSSLSSMSTDFQLNPAQARGHVGHSHSHGHHHHDNTYLTSKNKNDPGVKITRIGLYVNVGMAIGKGFGGYVFNSQALIADAIHSLSDLISDLTTLATISYSLRSPTTRFPTGYGKIESLGALAVSGFLLTGGFMIGLQAVTALGQQFFPEIAHILEHLSIFGHGHSHSHGAEDLGPNINAAWLAGGSILIKEWLYRATMKVAKEKRSTVLAGNAYHHRVDSLTAFVALLTITASHFLSNARWLDPVGGLVISGMIVQAGWGATKSALLELADVGLDQEMKDSIDKAATKAVDGTQGRLAAVQGVKSGQNFLIEIAVVVPETFSVHQTQQIETVVREQVSQDVKGVKRVAVRFIDEQRASSAFTDEFLAFDEDATKAPKEQTHDHDHDHDHAHDHIHEKHDSPNGTPDKKKG